MTNVVVGVFASRVDDVFRSAHHFTVLHLAAHNVRCFQSFPEAVEDAKIDESASVYAVTLEGVVAGLPRPNWRRFLSLWYQ